MLIIVVENSPIKYEIKTNQPTQGIIIWAVLDPTNPFVSPASAPFIIGMAYANMIWGFANVTIATNLARDLGTRIVAAIFWGGDAFNRYAAIAILVNVPATFFATCVYEIIQRDSFLALAKGHGRHEQGEDGLVRHLTKTGTIDSESAYGGNGGLGLERPATADSGFALNGRKES